MKSIEQLYDDLSARGIMFFNYSSVDSPAVAMEDDCASAIFVNENLVCTEAEEKEVVAHEAGHIFTGSLHRTETTGDVIARHEYWADQFAVQDLLPVEELIEAFQEGYTEIWQLAEWLNHTEEFIKRAIYIYQCKGML